MASLICSARVMYVFIFSRIAILAFSFFTYFSPKQCRCNSERSRHTATLSGRTSPSSVSGRPSRWPSVCLSVCPCACSLCPSPRDWLTRHEISQSLSVQRQRLIQLVGVVGHNGLFDDLHALTTPQRQQRCSGSRYRLRSLTQSASRRRVMHATSSFTTACCHEFVGTSHLWNECVVHGAGLGSVCCCVDCCDSTAACRSVCAV